MRARHWEPVLAQSHGERGGSTMLTPSPLSLLLSQHTAAHTVLLGATRCQGPRWELRSGGTRRPGPLFSWCSHHCGRRQETKAEKSPAIIIRCDIRKPSNVLQASSASPLSLGIWKHLCPIPSPGPPLLAKAGALPETMKIRVSQMRSNYKTSEKFNEQSWFFDKIKSTNLS